MAGNQVEVRQRIMAIAALLVSLFSVHLKQLSMSAPRQGRKSPDSGSSVELRDFMEDETGDGSFVDANSSPLELDQQLAEEGSTSSGLGGAACKHRGSKLPDLSSGMRKHSPTSSSSHSSSTFSDCHHETLACGMPTVPEGEAMEMTSSRDDRELTGGSDEVLLRATPPLSRAETASTATKVSKHAGDALSVKTSSSDPVKSLRKKKHDISRFRSRSEAKPPGSRSADSVMKLNLYEMLPKGTSPKLLEAACPLTDHAVGAYPPVPPISHRSSTTSEEGKEDDEGGGAAGCEEGSGDGGGGGEKALESGVERDVSAPTLATALHETEKMDRVILWCVLAQEAEAHSVDSLGKLERKLQRVRELGAKAEQHATKTEYVLLEVKKALAAKEEGSVGKREKGIVLMVNRRVDKDPLTLDRVLKQAKGLCQLPGFEYEYLEGIMSPEGGEIRGSRPTSPAMDSSRAVASSVHSSPAVAPTTPDEEHHVPFLSPECKEVSEASLRQVSVPVKRTYGEGMWSFEEVTNELARRCLEIASTEGTTWKKVEEVAVTLGNCVSKPTVQLQKKQKILQSDIAMLELRCSKSQLLRQICKMHHEILLIEIQGRCFGVDLEVKLFREAMEDAESKKEKLQKALEAFGALSQRDNVSDSSIRDDIDSAKCIKSTLGIDARESPKELKQFQSLATMVENSYKLQLSIIDKMDHCVSQLKKLKEGWLAGVQARLTTIYAAFSPSSWLFRLARIACGGIFQLEATKSFLCLLPTKEEPTNVWNLNRWLLGLTREEDRKDDSADDVGLRDSRDNETVLHEWLMEPPRPTIPKEDAETVLCELIREFSTGDRTIEGALTLGVQEYVARCLTTLGVGKDDKDTRTRIHGLCGHIAGYYMHIKKNIPVEKVANIVSGQCQDEVAQSVIGIPERESQAMQLKVFSIAILKRLGLFEFPLSKLSFISIASFQDRPSVVAESLLPLRCKPFLMSIVAVQGPVERHAMLSNLLYFCKKSFFGTSLGIKGFLLARSPHIARLCRQLCITRNHPGRTAPEVAWAEKLGDELEDADEEWLDRKSRFIRSIDGVVEIINDILDQEGVHGVEKEQWKEIIRALEERKPSA